MLKVWACGRHVPDANGNCVGALIETAMVEFHAAVVQVDTVDELRVALVLLQDATVLIGTSKVLRLGNHSFVNLIEVQTILPGRPRAAIPQAACQCGGRTCKRLVGPHIHARCRSVKCTSGSAAHRDGAGGGKRGWPRTEPSLYWKTGRCCRMWCLTADTSVMRTQYLVVDRTNPCALSSFFTPLTSPRSWL